jgi:sugar/nucleoside kinase (ribokinase family)
VVYLEGYLWDRPPAMEAYRKAAKIAHANGGKVSLSLSDSFCVHRHRDAFLDLVASEVDILFANESELLALYGTDSLEEGFAHVREHCEIAVVTLGKHGSAVLTPDDHLEIPAEHVDDVVDTTGAGDLYAAGFLFGYTQDLPLGECGRLGSVAAAEVISHVGARPLVNLRRLAGLG